MYLRKKKNKSGVISVQIIDKSTGKYRVLKTIGSSSDPAVIEELIIQGHNWMQNHLGLLDMFAEEKKQEGEKLVVDYLLSNIKKILINGTELILDKVYKSIGFEQIDDDILKHLVIARLSQPMSKLATVAYLKDYFDYDIHYQKIYRYMDRLNNSQKDLIQKISVKHTKKVSGGDVGLLFYDVTTLYFESEQQDELRHTGFSKDGKHTNVQVVLGLLVSKQGYPLSYSIFNGSQYEGYTMLPVIEDFIQRFELKNFVIVADSGLMNKTNIKLLKQAGYKYILGARIKNETQNIQQWILSLNKEDGRFYQYQKDDERLIIIYSSQRAKMDSFNRDKGVKRLRSAYKSGKVTKENINKRGYNKFLEITKDVEVIISNQKIKEDKKWDGLKGYITNTDLPAQEVYHQYQGLWIIEKAFRITKGTIELRPMFHFTPKRIEAHVAICFVAYKVYKELERVLKIRGMDLSVDKVLDIAKTITTIEIELPSSKEKITKTMLLTKKQKSIANLFEKGVSHNLCK